MVQRKKLHDLPNEESSGDAGWLGENTKELDTAPGSQHYRDAGMRALAELEGVDFSKHEFDQVRDGKMTSEQLVKEDIKQYDTYVDKNAELPKDIVDMNVEHLEEDDALRRRAQTYRVIKESPKERERAIERSFVIAAATEGLADDEFAGSREQLREMSDQAVDPTIIPGTRGYVEEYGQYEAEF